MMLIGSLLFVALIAAGVAMVVHALRGQPPRVVDAAPGQNALQILEDRYARGDIDREEFEERRSTLRT